ncbi:MAG: segregation/condensation protein A [Candidatus Adlerbacteria bacterium]|nr:segregation/condensation protein A [Candidatus Adlerbacteria bacterium]
MQTRPHVKTDVFEGPLELLLELIEKRKLHISDVSLAAVTDEYIARISAHDHLPVGETAEFVTLAATLLLIKSRSLLPTLALSEEESRDIKELEYRLALYQLIKDAARGVQEATKNPMLHEGEAAPQQPLYLFDPSITKESLLGAAQVLIAGFPKSLVLPKVAVKKIVSIEEMITQMAARVSSAFRLSFKEFAGMNKQASAHARQEIIISFLALLELVKQGIIKANQGEHFSDIMLESDSVSVPSYE